jgi:peptide/nickel transport system substrate-binding protein
MRTRGLRNEKDDPVAARLSRRQFLGAAGAGLTAAGVAACSTKAYNTGGNTGGSGPGGAHVASGPPGPGPVSGGAYGGTVNVNWVSEANSFDPIIGYNTTAWDALTSLLNTPLYQFAGQFGPAAPALAAALPEVTDGGLRYVIKLRPGAKFSTGREIVADDYVYSWTRVLNPKLASWASSYLIPVVGSGPVINGKSTTLTGVKALDDHTVEVRLEQPTFTFLNTLAQPYMAAVPREVVEKDGAEFGTHPTSTGPFVVQSYSQSSQSATFARNPHYAWKGLPYLAGVNYRWGVNSQLELLQLEQGSVEIIGDGIGATLAAQVQAESNLAKYVDRFPVNATAWIQLNCAKGPLADTRVRQALNWATDRAAVTKVAHSVYKASGYPLPSNLAEYPRTAKPFGYDPARARSLLAQAGVTKLQMGFVTDGSDPWLEIAQVLQQQWAAFGVHITINTMSTSAYDTLTTTSPLRTQSYQDDYYMTQPSALDLIIPNFTSDGSYNYSGYKNATIDSLTTQAEHQTTLATSNTYVAKIEEELVADPPAVFLADIGFLAGRSPTLRNFRYRGETGSYYGRMWM